MPEHNPLATIELLLFISGEAGLSLSELSSLANLSKAACQQQLERLMEKYLADDNSALTIIETAGKFRMSTKEQFADVLKNYAKTPLNQTLSKSALEVLSIVAYKQPITRLEIDQLRGVNSSGTLATLRAFDLVQKVGTLEVPGRPSLYATTDFFLDYIGINQLSELPEVDDAQFSPEKTILFNENESENHEN